MRLTLAAVALALATVPAVAADNFIGEVLAHDRVAHRIVLDDKTIVTYDPATVSVPQDLAAGDKVEVVFGGGEEGDFSDIQTIERVE